MSFRLANDHEACKDGWVQGFRNLIDSNPTEIRIWEGLARNGCSALDGGDCDCEKLPHESHRAAGAPWGDIEIFYPCGDAAHHRLDCGRFVWTLVFRTRAHEAEARGEGEKIDDDWWASIVVDTQTVLEEDVPQITTAWIERWVQPLSGIPVRMVTYEERRTLAKAYAERHPEEQADLYTILEETREKMIMEDED